MKKDLLKFPLKRVLLSAVILCSLSAIFTSCGDDAEGRITLNDKAPAKVTNVTTAAGPGEVYITWTNPTSESFMYTKIEYTDSKGAKRYSLISKERANENKVATATIKGFANTDKQTFSLFACSVRGNNEGAIEVSQAPESPAFQEVAKTITVEPALGGVLINYKNDYNTTVLIALEYRAASDSKKSGSTKFEVAGNSKGPRLVQLSYGENQFLAGEECIINICAEDEYDNASSAVELKVTPIEAVKIDRSNWSFPGYNAGSNDGTIGYSSQEAQGEGDQDGLKNGRVISMIDSSLKTYWHASWKVASDYPHWFILDMGKDVTVASVELTRRQGNAKGQKGQIIYTCADSDALDKNNPDSCNWTNHGSFTFDPNKDAPQSFGLASTPKARYIKIYFGTEHKGSDKYAMLSDLNVYGLE